MKISLQYKWALILMIFGAILFISTLSIFWSVAGIALAAGGLGILLIYLEKKWIEHEYLKNGLIFTLLFAIIYGILEYIFFDSTWNYWFKISAFFPNKYFYWIFMAVLNFSLVFIFSHKSFALSIMSIPLFSVNEDLWYWITKSVHNGIWVFPVPNWFDQRFSIFGLGEPIPIFPFFPRFYFVGWILIGLLIFIQNKNPEDKEFSIFVLVYCICSFACLLLVPQSYNKLFANLSYFFQKIQHQFIFI